MKSTLRFAAVLCLCSSSAFAENVAIPPDLTKLAAAESAMFETFGQADAQGFEHLAGDDYFTINADGATMDRAGAVKLLPRFKGSRSVLTERMQRVYGSAAVLTGHAKFYFKFFLVADVNYTQVWVWRDARWQFVNWQGTMTGLPSWYPAIVTGVMLLIVVAIVQFVLRRRARVALAAA